MITDRDICLAVARADRLPSAIPVSEVMSQDVFCCGPEDDVHAALQVMRNRKVRRLPVVDADGKLRGIVSMDDVVLHAERGTGRRPPVIGYGETVRTLKAIYQKPGGQEAADDSAVGTAACVGEEGPARRRAGEWEVLAGG